jgi:uncharacterized protein
MEQQNNWHLSKYNVFSSKMYDNKIPCVNLLKGTYSELDPNDLLKLYELEKNNIKEEDLKDFIAQGIVTNFDEKEYVKSSLLINYNRMNNLTVIIAPSLTCNFNCPYCFERHTDNNVMNKETQDKVINFLKNLISFSWKKQLEIIWYGGEPLLHPEIIEYISNSIISFCQSRGINYTSSILTNGYFFNQENVDLLNRCNVTSAQITIDGLEKNHNLTRHLFDGSGTFKKIIENLNSVKFNGTISIRNDIHSNNKEDIEGIKKIIQDIREKTGNKINYYTAPIIDVPAEKQENQVEFLNIKDTIEFEFKRRNEKIPQFKTTYCSAPSLYFFGIGSRGELYKCWEDFGVEERSYGNIDKWDIRFPLQTASNPNILMKYINSAGALDSECSECVWLPICSGGCPSKRFFCNMKCLPYVPYRYDVDYYIEKIREKYINMEKGDKCNYCGST